MWIWKRLTKYWNKKPKYDICRNHSSCFGVECRRYKELIVQTNTDLVFWIGKASEDTGKSDMGAFSDDWIITFNISLSSKLIHWSYLSRKIYTNSMKNFKSGNYVEIREPHIIGNRKILVPMLLIFSQEPFLDPCWTIRPSNHKVQHASDLVSLEIWYFKMYCRV